MLNPRYFLSLIAIAFGLMAIALLTAAHAAADPVAQTATVTDGGWQLVQSYGPIWAGVLLVHDVASRLLVANASTHWLTQGRTLAMIVAGVGLLGAVLEAQLGGQSWSGVVVTLVAAVKMLWSPTVQPAPVVVKGDLT